MNEASFIHDVLCNPHTRRIVERLPSCELPDAWLVAGCLFQTVWNLHDGQPPDANISDYDIFYCNPTDLSPEAEQAVQARVNAVMSGILVTLDVKNQARVHTWYPDYFGKPCPALTSSRDGIDRFLVRCTCVGVQVSGDARQGLPERLTVYAPYGLDDLYAGTCHLNALTPHSDLFRAKVASYLSRWPWLRVDELNTSGTA